MKVVVSVMGRFHAFDLAAQLERRGHLERLVTSLPRARAARYGIPAERVSSVLSNELLRRAWWRLPRALRDRWDARLRLCEHFDARAARRLRPGADLLVGWSGATLQALRRAAQLGMATIAERGSSHVLYARELLTEEYEKHGLPARVAHPGVVERELAAYDQADRVAVPSSFVKRTFLERGFPESKLIHVPYGVSISGFSPPSEREPVFRIVHCGRVNLRKGCHYLLQAFHELRLPGAELVFVGTLEPEMDAFVRRWGSPAVTFSGAVPQAELPAHYRRAAVFCLASVEEGLAMVLAQAMACGLPVVATRNTGAEDLVSEGREGFVVPIRDVEALKQKLLWLYENREARQAMGREARRRVESGFGWDDYGERVTRAYAELLEARSGA